MRTSGGTKAVIKKINRLSARAVATLTKTGRHSDGGNLYLKIDKAGGQRWVFMYEHRGKQREAGLGPAAAVSLAEARGKAGEYRSLLAKGIDPLDAKKTACDAATARQTFGQCADALIKSKTSEWRNASHAAQWATTLKHNCAAIRDLPVDLIDTAAVLSVLQPMWQLKHVTASRIRGRIEAVLDAARAKGHIARNEANPARWKGHLETLLPRRQKLSLKHHAAMAYRDIPEFIGRLRERKTMHRLALEFLILTATRLGEVRGARWSEVDIAGKVWTIPAARMKAGREHRVPLSSRALAILARLAEFRTGELVFPGQRPARPVSANAIRTFCPDAGTVHGFRSSFRDWVSEETNYPRELAEAALAHATGSAVEQAYRRGDALEKRRGLMEAWASYCEGGAAGNVIPITRAAN
jgi:integrase